MKLLTHNMLTSVRIKGVNTGYPLGINEKDVKIVQVDFNQEFISRILTKIDWTVLFNAAVLLGHAEDLPSELVTDWEKDEKFLRKAHHVLLEIEVVEGELVCPESGRRFPINNGIPNMLLNETEIDP